MGLSIHYSGSFREDASLPDMIEEVKEVAEAFDWPYIIFDRHFPENLTADSDPGDTLYGICFDPPGCETVFFSFLANRKMSSAGLLYAFGNSTNKTEQEYLYMVSLKTQYAGIDIHKTIVHLMRHLNSKYFHNFSVSDEGEYWETGDEKVLKENFDRYTRVIDQFSLALDTLPIEKGESLEGYFERLIKIIHSKGIGRK